MYHEKLNNEKFTNYETQIFNKTFSKFRSLKLRVKTEYNLGDYYFCLFKKANTSKMQEFTRIVNKENIDLRKASITNVSKNRQSVIKLANTSRLGLRVV